MNLLLRRALAKIVASFDYEVEQDENEYVISIEGIGSLVGDFIGMQDEEEAFTGYPLGLDAYGEQEAKRIYSEIENINLYFYIQSIDIEPAYRNQGYGSQLLEALENEVKNKVEAIIANASPQGTDQVPFSVLKRFYQKSGYEFLTLYKNKNGLIIKRL